MSDNAAQEWDSGKHTVEQSWSGWGGGVSDKGVRFNCALQRLPLIKSNQFPHRRESRRSLRAIRVLTVRDEARQREGSTSL